MHALIAAVRATPSITRARRLRRARLVIARRPRGRLVIAPSNGGATARGLILPATCGRARDRRRRATLRRHHQPARGARRRHRHGGPRRRGDRRCGVRAVPSDRDRYRPRPGAARDRSLARRRRDADQLSAASASCVRCTRMPNWRRATSWPAPCIARSRAGRGAFLDCARRSAREFAEHFPTVYAACIARRHRSGHAADPGRAGRALPHGRDRHRRAAAAPRVDGLWACGEVASTGAARRQPAGLQLAARSGGVRRPRRQTTSPAARHLPRPLMSGPAESATMSGSHDERLEQVLRRTMAAEVGVVRDGTSLARALAAITSLVPEAGERPSPRQYACDRQADHRGSVRAQGKPRRAFPQRLPCA